MSSEQLARRIAAIADGKQAEDIVVLNVGELVGYTDFLVICTARNERLAKAIHDEVYAELKREERLPDHVEGERRPSWVLMDYLDCVLHVFLPEARDYYRLDTLWGEAPRLDVASGAAPTLRTG